MKRRTLLAALATLPAIGITGRVWATPPGQARVLLVFLRGGYDAANVLVPVASTFYYESRPNIAIARPSGDPQAALALTPEWGLHPALRETIFPLYQRGEVAFLPFAGTDDISRSHFETQDSIELGQPPGQSRDFGSGFLNRLAGQLGGARPVSFTDQLPLSFRGSVEVPNVALRSVGKPALDPRQSAVIAAMYRGTLLESPVTEGFTVRDEVQRGFAAEMAAADRNAVPARGFELEAVRIARLMRQDHNLGFVDIGGWDTHVGEGSASGYLAGRLDELGRGLRAFADNMGEVWSDTVVIVISEFGRTFRENGNRGTDHGHGTVYWLLGGAVRGGRVIGDDQRIERSTLFQDRDYPVRYEYRGILGGIFQKLYGLGRARLAAVFPDADPRDLGIL